MFFLHQLICQLFCVYKNIKIKLSKTECFTKYFVFYVKITVTFEFPNSENTYENELHYSVL